MNKKTLKMLTYNFIVLYLKYVKQKRNLFQSICTELRSKPCVILRGFNLCHNHRLKGGDISYFWVLNPYKHF